jgi:hypothetical protein
VTYVEGYVIPHDLIIPVKHAWVEFDSGVLDITYRIENENPEQRNTYFGVEYTQSSVEAASVDSRTGPLASVGKSND